MPGRLMLLRLTAVLSTCCSAMVAVLEPEGCDVVSDGACGSGLSLLQTGQRRIARGAGGMADLAVAVAEAVADASDDITKGGAEGGDAAQHGAERNAEADFEPDVTAPEWSEALLQRASRTSFLSSLESAISSKLFGGDSSATEAVRGAQQLAKVVGNASIGEGGRSINDAAKGNCTMPSKHDSFEIYLGCLSDRCEDGAAELSGGVGCSVMVSSGCGTDLHSLHHAVPAGIFVGRLCALSCGWCGDDPRALAARAAAAGAAEMLAATAKRANHGVAETMEAAGAAETLIATGAQWGRAER